MPSKYHIREFTENAYYHVFNRGFQREKIFYDDKDYSNFIYLLKSAVSPPPLHPSSRKNFYQEIRIVAFCLMPNHFHLLIFQKNPGLLTSFMKSIAGLYTYYFNKKYDRVGTLYQSKYRAKRITTDEYLLHLSRYIHLNPIPINSNVFAYPYSSIQSYCSGDYPWIYSKPVLDILGKSASQTPYDAYREFLSKRDGPSEGPSLETW